MQIAPNRMHVLHHLGHAETIRPAHKYGIPAVQVARSVVHLALLAEAEQRGIPVLYRKRLRAIACRAAGVAAEFEDRSAAEGALLIGADGLRSATRQLLFPDGPSPAYTGLSTVGGFASHPGFVPAGPQAMRRAHMIFGRDGFFGYDWFDRHNPSTVMWWSHLSRDREPARDEYQSWPTEDLRRELLERYRDWPTAVATILGSAAQLLRGPVYDVPSIPAWSKDRVLLIGDAAHAISPHARQGASLALEDALALAKLLRSRAPHEEVFAQSVQARRSRVERIIAEARRRGDGKRTLTPTAVWISDRFLSVFGRVWGGRMNDWIYSYKMAWEN